MDANHRFSKSPRFPRGLLFRLAVSLFLVPSAACVAPRPVGVAVLDAKRLAVTEKVGRPDRVEVFLDAAPPGRVSPVALLSARAVEAPVAIARMQEKAAELGLDGIYWIECGGPCSGDCTAKGFVYDQPSMAGANVAAR